MPKKDPRIDAYIEKAQPFAKPILKKLRASIHKSIPEIEENIKWGMPSFEFKGNLCGFASFKQHCTFMFWKASIMKDRYGYLQTKDRDAMGQFGRITKVDDLPSDKILEYYLKQAAELNDKNIKLPPRKAAAKLEDVKAPADMMKQLKSSKEAMNVWREFSNSQKKEYVEWIAGAKTEETRQRRLDTAVEWISEGKIRNWKYVRK